MTEPSRIILLDGVFEPDHPDSVAKYFDMVEIAPNLLIGSVPNELHPSIKSVVSLIGDVSYKRSEHQLIFMSYFKDHKLPPVPQIKGLASLVSHLRTLGPVLVHCQAGFNRSALIAAQVLIDEGMLPVNAVDLIVAKRPGALHNLYFADYLLEQQLGRLPNP